MESNPGSTLREERMQRQDDLQQQQVHIDGGLWFIVEGGIDDRSPSSAQSGIH